MGGFLVVALAIPGAFEGDGLAFGIAYLVVVALHTAMYMRGASVAEAKVMLRIGSYNLGAAVLVVAGGALGSDAQWALSTIACLVWVTPWLARLDAMVVGASHFVERHGLVVIVALGELIVVIGVGAAGLPLDVELVLVALLSLALSAALWWTYFRDEHDVEDAMVSAEPGRRARLALLGFGYWHFGLLLGAVAVAAGLRRRSVIHTTPWTSGSAPSSPPELRSSSPAPSASDGRSDCTAGRSVSRRPCSRSRRSHSGPRSPPRPSSPRWLRSSSVRS
jgi:low temperature requirement protein LtrA